MIASSPARSQGLKNDEAEWKAIEVNSDQKSQRKSSLQEKVNLISYAYNAIGQ